MRSEPWRKTSGAVGVLIDLWTPQGMFVVGGGLKKMYYLLSVLICCVIFAVQFIANLFIM